MILPETVLQDLRYGARMLYRNLGFTAVAILALSLGIGVNTAVFTAYKAMVARPLDARDPGEMVNLALVRDSDAREFTFSYPDYEAYRDSAHSFSGVIAFNFEHMRLTDAGAMVSQRTSVAESGVGRLGLAPGGASNAEFAAVFVVSENYFRVLGVGVQRGRSFEAIPASELAASPSVLISDNYWQKRFAHDASVLGKTIRLNGVALTIAGVTPHDFVGTGIGVPDFWLPLSLAPLVHADDRWLSNREHQCCRLFAHLAPGISIAQAQAEMNLLTDRLRKLHDPKSEHAKPATALVWPGSPFPLPIRSYPGLELTIVLIMAAAGMVMAVACANVGSLQLARARSRLDELGTRLALGASRLRVVRQLLTESALLGLLAGVLALFCSWAFLRIAVSLAAQFMPADEGTLIFDVTPDLAIFVYVFAISLVAGVLFGLAPAIESSHSALASTVRGRTSSVRTRRIQGFLIAAQVAFALVLMIAGSLLIRSAINTLRMETGYDSKRVVDVDFRFPEAPQYTDARKLALVREFRTRLADLPAVAEITSAHPPGDNRFRTAAALLNGEKSSTNNVKLIHYTYVQANYFQTLGIPVSGHIFQSRTGEPERSLILSESAAKELWPGQNPIGRTIRLGAIDEQVHNQRELVADGPIYQVIGTARDVRGAELNGSDSRQLYLPLSEERLQAYPILIRAQADPATVMRAIDPLILSVDPGTVTTTSTLEELLRVSASFIVSTFAAAVATTVGLLGLLLASMGIYGTVTYIVLLRTREIGIRMAIGAQKRDIFGLVLRDSTRPVLVGLLVGMLLATGNSYLLHRVLYGLSAFDGISFVGVSLLFLAIALLAAYPPSRQAMRVDPIVALRYE